MAKKKKLARAESSESFEVSLAELESIVTELESGSLPLADALARYEVGVKHLSMCQRLLERAERRIELLSGVDANGNPITRPFDDAETASLEEKAQSRGKRRTSDAKRSTSKDVADDENMDEAPRLF
jgi:exodeoxyribonuclease VII small subunit